MIRGIGQTIFIVILSVVSLSLGLFIIFRPLRVFEIQKRFYALINWRIEPISLPKEIRNTKFMGLFLVVFVVVLWIALFFLESLSR
ncbi:MAG: hypothetical protein ABIJ41_07150 [Candidatus Omnitrophota bacterium]